jgi:FlaA1/EpsC-like NDP-sugar epimerase
VVLGATTPFVFYGVSNHMTAELWRDKRVAVTGVAGTIGRELVRHLLPLGVREIVGIDNNESALFFLQERLRPHPNVQLFFGDLRDPNTLIDRLKGAEIVLHAAALKHVGLSEQSPREAVSTNIVGTQNVIDAATRLGVDRVVLTSSDKAVNPTNVMGTSKLMGERLMTAANASRIGTAPVFGSTRFGNVLGSRGSVVPIYKRQIRAGGPVTLTHRDMTRFVMSLDEAAKLVLDSAFRFLGGEVFITKMSAVRIADLAAVMIAALAPLAGRRPSEIEIVETGLRPGEKMLEELMTDSESAHAVESDEYFIILPALKSRIEKREYTYDGLAGRPAEKPYNSHGVTPMPRAELHDYLLRNNLLALDESD